MKKAINTVIAILIFIGNCLNAQTILPTQTSTIFSGSGKCATCHTGNGTVLSENGVDISPVTHWRSTMMGNSSKDPFWRAIVEEEVHEHPQLKEVIENTCTRCHAPAGNRESIQLGNPTYSIAQMKADPLANDGVTCTVCHQIQDSNYGSSLSFSGGYNITTDRVIFGPYTNPLAQPMITNVGYTPVYTVSIHSSEHCATCHTLFTPTVDYSGQIVGMFAEQTPYIEWKNSKYQNEGIQCQTCHMPKTDTPIDISTTPPFNTTLRTPYWKHYFVGGNKLMNSIIKDNIALLGISATSAQFDTTMSHTENLLSNSTIKISLNPIIENDFLKVAVSVENLAGHKIPSGIPFRRMWIHLKVTDQNNNPVFESGKWDSNGEIIGLDSVYEKHYDLITNEEQVQIYEAITKDVNGNVTKNLLRSAGYLKDNRIPPKGFTSSHPSYDTVAVFGEALNDSNYNRNDTEEGTGIDIIYYKIPVESGNEYQVYAEVCYQPLSPRLVEYLQGMDSPDILQFVSLYGSANKSPTILNSALSPILTGIKEIGNNLPKDFYLTQNSPNPFNPITRIKYNVPFSAFVSIKVYDLLGNNIKSLVEEYKQAGTYEIDFNGSNLSSGTYYYQLTSGKYSTTKKMVLIK